MRCSDNHFKVDFKFTFVQSKLICVHLFHQNWFCVHLYCQNWFCVHLYCQNCFCVTFSYQIWFDTLLNVSSGITFWIDTCNVPTWYHSRCLYWSRSKKQLSQLFVIESSLAYISRAWNALIITTADVCTLHSKNALPLYSLYILQTGFIWSSV